MDHVQDPEDWYKFDAGSGNVIVITLESWNNTIMNLTLFDPNDNMALAFYSDGPVARDIYYTEHETPMDTWYIRLTSINGWYEFKVNLTSQNDTDTGQDVPNDPSNATEVDQGGDGQQKAGTGYVRAWAEKWSGIVECAAGGQNSVNLTVVWVGIHGCNCAQRQGLVGVGQF